jgi:hypothetical protein
MPRPDRLTRIAIATPRCLAYGLVSVTSIGSIVRSANSVHPYSIPTLVRERLDPIVNINDVAMHMHRVLVNPHHRHVTTSWADIKRMKGGSNFAAAYNYDDLVASPCTSVELQADKSNYWMVHNSPTRKTMADEDRSAATLLDYETWRPQYYLFIHEHQQPFLLFPWPQRRLPSCFNNRATNGSNSARISILP